MMFFGIQDQALAFDHGVDGEGTCALARVRGQAVGEAHLDEIGVAEQLGCFAQRLLAQHAAGRRERWADARTESPRHVEQASRTVNQICVGEPALFVAEQHQRRERAGSDRRHAIDLVHDAVAQTGHQHAPFCRTQAAQVEAELTRDFGQRQNLPDLHVDAPVTVTQHVA
jgi:hypothetical protein